MIDFLLATLNVYLLIECGCDLLRPKNKISKKQITVLVLDLCLKHHQEQVWKDVQLFNASCNTYIFWVWVGLLVWGLGFGLVWY